jgi:hypothetical protein
MLQAQLRGKLTREEEDMEDLLTSNVFGSISYMAPEEGLLPLLSNSQDRDGNSPVINLNNVSKIEYLFWPWIEEKGCKGCEPDVFIKILFTTGKKIMIFVEAKYFSKKSSEASDHEEAPFDQLAREWDNLQELSRRERAEPIFIYITADLSYPIDSLADSQRDYLKHRTKEMRMFWISWRKLPRIFSNRKQDNMKRDILSDLVDVLNRQGLTFFEGITLPVLTDSEWLFKASINWRWSSYREVYFSWKYRNSKNYNWKYQIESFDWRFKSG